MPIQPTYPGVYVQEIPSGVKTITGVSTSTAAFFGRMERGPVNKAVRCTSFADFVRAFGKAHPESDLKNSVKQFFDNGGNDCYVVRLAHAAAIADLTLQNGDGADFLIISATSAGEWGNNVNFSVAANGDGTFNMTVSEIVNGVTVTTEPTYVKLSMDPASPNYVVDFVTQNSNLIDVTTVDPIPPTTDPLSLPVDGDYVLGTGTGVVGTDDDGTPLMVTDYGADDGNFLGFWALERVDLFNLMVIPGDADIDPVGYQTLIDTASVYCEEKRAFLLVDAPASWTSGGIMVATANEVNALRVSMSKQYAAVFYPRIKFSDGGIIKTMGASGMIAGLMARTDSQRGVWKAPAGTEAGLRGAVDLEINLTDNENGILNKLGANCIRKFPVGIVNWGARTLDGFDDNGSEWKYIPIRRLALFLEESLFRGTKWVVFEPNDEPLWAQIRMNITAFMMGLFRQGAFQGSTPDKAFFVKCDAETTTQADRNLGIVNIQVGFAPLKPAEFVIITIQQMIGDLV